MFLVYYFFIWTFFFSGLEASGPTPSQKENFLSEEEEEKEKEKEKIIKKIEEEKEKSKLIDKKYKDIKKIDDFFKLTSCEMKDYNPNFNEEAGFTKQKEKSQEESDPSADQFSESEDILSCYINISDLEDKKAGFEYIKDPKNWTEEKIHPSIYDKYYYFSKRQIERQGDKIIIYSRLQNSIEKRIIKAIEKSDGCKAITSKKLKGDLEPGHYLSQACFLELEESHLETDSFLREFFSTGAMNEILNEQEFKSRIFKLINEYRKEHEQFEEDKSFLLSKSPKEGTVILKINIIEVKSEEKELQSKLLKNFTKADCSTLEQEEVKKFKESKKIGENEYYIQGCNILINNYSFPTEDLQKRFLRRSLLEKVFSDKAFKNEFIKEMNKNRQENNLELLSLDSKIFIHINTEGFGESKISFLNITKDKITAVKESILISVSIHPIEIIDVQEFDHLKNLKYIREDQKLDKGYKIWVEDDRFKRGGIFSEYIDEKQKKIEDLFNDKEFKKRFIEEVHKKALKSEKFNMQSIIFPEIEEDSEGEFYINIFDTKPIKLV